MADVSIVRARVKPEGREAMERGVQHLVAGRRAWKDAGALLACQVVRTDDGQGYVLASVWRDKATHDRHEDAPEEAKALRQLGSVLAAPPDEQRGEAIAEV